MGIGWVWGGRQELQTLTKKLVHSHKARDLVMEIQRGDGGRLGVG